LGREEIVIWFWPAAILALKTLVIWARAAYRLMLVMVLSWSALRDKVFTKPRFIATRVGERCTLMEEEEMEET
jgi:hypothetical protein